jgi:2',3'-cyclic-nucleotide 2'-phosphodiesterase (5'-nucleotidase family)
MRTTRQWTPPGSQVPLVLAMVALLVGCTQQSVPPAPPERVGAPVTAGTPPAPGLAPVARAGPGEVVLTLFHETHIHGMLLGRKQPSGAPADGRTFAHYMRLLDQQRRRLKAGASLVLGNGDDLSDELPVPPVLGGGTVGTEGRHAVEVFNAAGLDANTFGFNELDYVLNQPDRFRELVSRSRFAWVSANVRDGSRPSEVLAAEQGARRWTVERVGGVRVGITGVVSPDFELGDGAAAARFAPAVAVLDPVEALREVVPQMRAAGAQVVVVLSHLFYEQMERVAQQVDGVAVMVGSHHGPRPYHLLEEPRVVRSTILSIAGHDMVAVGQLDLIVRRGDGRVVRHAFHRHVPTLQGPVSPAVKAVLDRYLADRSAG